MLIIKAMMSFPAIKFDVICYTVTHDQDNKWTGMNRCAPLQSVSEDFSSENPTASTRVKMNTGC